MSGTEIVESSEIFEQSGILERRGDPKLYWQSHVPKDAPAQATTLVFVHGLAEHFGRYGYPIEYFTRLGWPCFGLDLRGHGRSGGRRVHIRRFSDYLEDVDSLITLVRRQRPEAPIFLIGHSMGGVVSILYAAERGQNLKGLVLSSPGLRAHPDSAPPSLLLLLGKIASLITPGLHFSSRLDASFISRNPEVVEAYRRDPLVTSKVTARWATEFLAAQKRCFKLVDRLTLPTLVMQSGDDRLVDPKATQNWASRLPPTSKFHLWPGLYHEMFNEPERPQVFEKMAGWIRQPAG